MARGKAKGEPSQREMVRQALEELGPDAKPLAIQEHIKQKYNRELTTGLISNYKSTSKNKGGGTGRRRGRPPGAGVVRLDDLEAVRGLVDRLGATQVKRLVDVVG